MQKSIAFILLFLFIPALATLAKAAPLVQTENGQVYIVQAEDWLSKLADKFYNDPLMWPAIWLATNTKATKDDTFAIIESPDLVEIGQKLWIPNPEEAQILINTFQSNQKEEVHNGLWISYTKADGLIDNQVRAIAIDQAGHQWIGTLNGVSQFDGQTWRSYQTLTTSLMSNYVQTITIDQSNHKWFGYGERGSGVSEFDGQTWRNYTQKDGLVNNHVYAITIDKNGYKWFGTENGVSKFDGRSWVSYTSTDGLVHNDVRDIATDQTSQLWFATAGGVSKFDGQTWTTYTKEDGLLSDDIYAVASDKNGDMWFGGREGLSRFDGQSWTTYTKDDAGFNVATFTIKAISIDEVGNKWLTIFTENYVDAALGAIVARFDNQGWHFYNGTQEGDFFDFNGGWAITIDNTKDKWVSTINGVGKISGSDKIDHLATNGIAYKVVKDIAVETNGQLWFATWGGGVSEFDGQTWTTHTTQGLVDNRINKIAIDKNGDKWFATAGGVSKFDGQTWTNYTVKDGLENPYITDVAIDKDGHKWFATINDFRSFSRYDGYRYGSNISKFDGENWINYPQHSFRVIDVDERGHVWGGQYWIEFGGARGRVWQFEDEDWIKYGCNSGILALAIDKAGYIWAGAEGAVIKCDGHTRTDYVPKHGLAGYPVYAVAIDKAGHKWFGTDGGVSKFDDKIWTTYTIDDGLTSNVVYAIAFDETGRKWFGTDNGVSVFNDR